MRCFAILLIAIGLSLASTLQYRGADFSSLLLLESTTDIQYTTSSNAAPKPFEQVLDDYGVNLARIRILTTGPYNLTQGLRLAKRAKAAGMALFLALYYSDTWATPGQQNIPYDWPTNLEELVPRVYKYTYELLQAFNDQGTPVQFIQIGNEINDGLLWPAGRITVNGFSGASQLLHAGALAVRAASPSAKSIIHLSNGWSQDLVSWFYSGIFTSETEDGLGGGLTKSNVDVLGFSFYPYYGTDATFAELTSTMVHLVSVYYKDIMIVETGWPVACDMLLSEPTISIDVKGQISWINGIVAVLNSVNHEYGDRALGIVYWEPGWIGNAPLGSHCADVLLVTDDGVARESMTVFSSM